VKVIDILNKIANNEELPLRIKVNGYEYRISNGQYYSDEKYMYLVDSSSSISHLNDEVEIIEEDKKIYKLDWVEGNTFNKIQENSYLSRKEIELLDSNFKELGNKINEIIDYINKGDKK
jgi:hypothetical protein